MFGWLHLTKKVICTSILNYVFIANKCTYCVENKLQTAQCKHYVDFIPCLSCI